MCKNIKVLTVDDNDKKRSKNKECSQELLDTLAKNIYERRLELGYSQEKLAELAGLHRTYISMIESRTPNMTLGVLESIAIALDSSLPNLLTK